MTQTLIQSNDCLFQVKIGDEYVSVICAKSFTVTIETEEKEITTVGDGAYKSYDYKVLSYKCSLNGAMRIPDGVTTTAFDWVWYQQGFYEVPFRAAWIDPSGQVRTFKGNGIVKSNNLVATASQLADATVDILGTGAFEIGSALEEFVTLNIIVTGNDSAPALVKIWLLNDLGDSIFLTDTLPQANGSMLGNPLNINVPVPRGAWAFYWYVDTNTVGNDISLTAAPGYTSLFNDGITQHNSYPIDTFDFTVNATVTVTLGISNPPPSCVAPAFLTGLNNPTATTSAPWSGTVTMSGSQPFSVTNVTMPSGMNISISGNTVTLDWPMPIGGDDQIISFDVTNACGTAHYADDISVSENADAVSINFIYNEGSGAAASACNASIYVNAVEVIHASTDKSESILVNPGDTIEVRIKGPSTASKRIEIVDSVDGVIYDVTTTTGQIHSHVFVTTLGHNYTCTLTSTTI